MTMRTLSAAVTAAMIMGLAGCRGGGEYVPQAVETVTPAKIAPGQEATLFPVAEGNQWVYSLQFQAQAQGEPVNQEDTVTFTMRNVANEPNGARRFVIEISRRDAPTQRQTWRVSPRGIFVIQQPAGEEAAQVAFNPPQIVMPFPVENDREFTWEGVGALPAGGVSGRSRISGRIVGVQEFDTDARRMSGVCVETIQQWTIRQPAAGGQPAQDIRGMAASSIWFVPNVGIARYRQELAFGNTVAVTVLRLKSHTVN
jgi:hypothetical protein